MTHPDEPLTCAQMGEIVLGSTPRNAAAWHWRLKFLEAALGAVRHDRSRIAKHGADHLLPLADEIERDLAVLITEARRRGLRPIQGGKP
jgi:hypothetical protein